MNMQDDMFDKSEEMSTNVDEDLDYDTENGGIEEDITAESGEDIELSDESSAVADISESEAEPKKKYQPVGRYDAVLYSVYSDEGLTQMLRILCYVAVGLTAYAFVYSLVTLIPTNPLEAIRYLVICGVPFILVSVMRRLLNTPRPYEILPFYEKAPKSKRGSGYPSRHVFSIFVIASTLAFGNIWLGIGLACLGVLLAVCRVLLGIHFIRDTVAGAVIGITAGIIGTYLTNLIF